MSLDFPASPTLNQTYSTGGRTWKWNGEGWALVSDIAGSIATAMLADGAVTAAKASIASQAQAEAGTNTTTLMTPERTAQAISKQGLSIGLAIALG